MFATTALAKLLIFANVKRKRCFYAVHSRRRDDTSFGPGNKGKKHSHESLIKRDATHPQQQSHGHKQRPLKV